MSVFLKKAKPPRSPAAVTIASSANSQIFASRNTLSRWKPMPEKAYFTAYATTKRIKNQQYKFWRRNMKKRILSVLITVVMLGKILWVLSLGMAICLKKRGSLPMLRSLLLLCLFQGRILGKASAAFWCYRWKISSLIHRRSGCESHNAKHF